MERTLAAHFLLSCVFSLQSLSASLSCQSESTRDNCQMGAARMFAEAFHFNLICSGVTAKDHL
jgi:hypothetical protein